MSKLLNEIRNLSNRIDVLRESTDNNLKTEFNRIMGLFKDYPEDTIEAKEMGFSIGENNLYYTWSKGGLLYGVEWGENLLNPVTRKENGLHLTYYDENRNSLYGYTRTASRKENVSIYLYDIDTYAKYGLKNIKYLRKEITRDFGDDYYETYYAKYNTDIRETEIDKPWFFSYDKRVLKAADDKGLDLSPISKEEF